MRKLGGVLADRRMLRFSTLTMGEAHSGSKIYNHHAAFVDATRTKSSLYNPLTPMDDVQLMSRCLRLPRISRAQHEGAASTPASSTVASATTSTVLPSSACMTRKRKESLWEIWLGRRAHHSPGDIPIYEIQEYLEEMGFYFVRSRPHSNH